MGVVTLGWPSVALAGQFSFPSTADATFTAPPARALQVLNIHFTYNSTATVGTRLIAILGRDASGNILWRATCNAFQTASQNFMYSFQSAVSEVVNLGGRFTLSLPPYATIPPGGSIRVFEEYSIDPLDVIGVLAMTYTALV